MDGEQGLDAAAEIRARAVLGLEQQRDDGGMPVVQMQQVRPEIEARQRVAHGPAEPGILLDLPVAALVDAFAEIVFVIQQIDGDAVQIQLFQAHVLTAPAQVEPEIGQVAHLIAVFFLDAAVIGYHHPAVETHAVQIGGQGAHHVGQTAGLGQRRAFGGHHQDILFVHHRRTPFRLLLPCG